MSIEVLILLYALYSLSVKNEAKISGWRFIWFFRFDVGALLADLMILAD